MMPLPNHTDDDIALAPLLTSAQLDTQTDRHAYLTYKLEVIKTLAVSEADPFYQQVSGLRVRELRLLRLIHDYPDITASELKVKLVVDKTLLSKHLAGLEQRGLVEKIPDKEDNRIQRLRLTVAGEQAWQACETIGRGLEAAFFGELSTEEWQELHRLLDKTLQSLLHWQSKTNKKA